MRRGGWGDVLFNENLRHYARTHSLSHCSNCWCGLYYNNMNGIDAIHGAESNEACYWVTHALSRHTVLYSRRFKPLGAITRASIFDLITRARHPLCACKHTGLILYINERTKWSGTREDVATLTADLQPDWALEIFTLCQCFGVDQRVARAHPLTMGWELTRHQCKYCTFYSAGCSSCGPALVF
jgi:hypothetical protein